MRRLRLGSVGFAIMLAAVLPGAAAGCLPEILGGFPGLSGLFRQSNLELMATAEQMVSPAYPNALLIEVLGMPSSGTAQTAADIDRWQFRFSEDPAAPGAGTVWVDYESGLFSGPFYTEQGLVGTVFEPLPRTMSLADALAHARAAGYADDFSSVTYRLPLTFPQPEEALYALSMPGPSGTPEVAGSIPVSLIPEALVSHTDREIQRTCFRETVRRTAQASEVQMPRNSGSPLCC